MRLNTRRSLFVSLAAAYTVVFYLTYVNFVAPVYSYLGLSYNPPPIQYAVLSWCTALIPAFWLPIQLTRPTHFILIVTYFATYIPPLFMVYHCSRPQLELADAAKLVVVLFIGMTILQAASLCPLKPISRPHMSSGPMLSVLIAVTAISAGYLFVSGARPVFTLDFQEIYAYRSMWGAATAGLSYNFANYAQLWLLAFACPTAFAFACTKRRPWLAVGALASVLVLYSITLLRAALFFPVWGLYLWYLVTRLPRYFSTGLAVALILLLLVGPIVAALPGGAGPTVIGMVNCRTFTVPAVLMVQYYGFFSENPTTKLSHVAGISRVIPYPYARPLAAVIGAHYYDYSMEGANAGMWAMDGLAGFGLPGIIIISVLCGTFMWFFDSVVSGIPIVFSVLSLSFIVIVFSSASFFTTTFSGGWLFLLLLMILMPKKAFPLGPGARSLPRVAGISPAFREVGARVRTSVPRAENW